MVRNVNGLRGMLNTKAAAGYVGMHIDSFRKWIKNPTMVPPRYYRLGVRNFFKPEDLDAWVEKLKQ